MRKVAVSLVVATMAAANAAWAADYPKPYDSTYEMTMEGYGTQQIHYMSDGKGHERDESTDPKGAVSVVLLDYPQHTVTSTTVMDGKKRFMKSPLPDYEGNESFKKGAKELGAKEIDGHPCHGWEITNKNGQVNQIWTDDKTDCAVLTLGLGPGPKITTELKSYVDTAPTFSMELPSDYTLYP